MANSSYKWIGLLATIAYGTVVAALLLGGQTGSAGEASRVGSFVHDNNLNEVGDLLAGVLAPISLMWVAIAVMMQTSNDAHARKAHWDISQIELFDRRMNAFLKLRDGIRRLNESDISYAHRESLSAEIWRAKHLFNSQIGSCLTAMDDLLQRWKRDERIVSEYESEFRDDIMLSPEEEKEDAALYESAKEELEDLIQYRRLRYESWPLDEAKLELLVTNQIRLPQNADPLEPTFAPWLRRKAKSSSDWIRRKFGRVEFEEDF